MSMTDWIVSILNKVPSPVASIFRSESVLSRWLRPLVNHFVPSSLTPIVVRSGVGKGLQLLIYPRHEKYYWTGTHEIHVQEAILRILNPGMTFWDVGTHIGFFTLLASRIVGESGHIHSFEPLDQNLERLMASIRLNGFTNITTHNLALAASSGEAILHSHKSSTMWSLVNRHDDREGISVCCRTMDEVADSLGQPDLIKIDVEGAEVDVLRGGLHLLSTRKPVCIVEFESERLVQESCGLFPFYNFMKLASNHYLMTANKQGGE